MSQRSKPVTIDLSATTETDKDAHSGDAENVASTQDFLASVAASMAVANPQVLAEQVNAHRRHVMTSGRVKPGEMPPLPSANLGMLVEASIVHLMQVYSTSLFLQQQQINLHGAHVRVVMALPAPNGQELIAKHGGGAFAILNEVSKLLSSHLNRIQDQTDFLSRIHRPLEL